MTDYSLLRILEPRFSILELPEVALICHLRSDRSVPLHLGFLNHG